MKTLFVKIMLWCAWIFSVQHAWSQSRCALGNCENGIGWKVWDDGDYYFGEFKNGEIEGLGRFRWSVGIYSGYFIETKMDGKGIYVENNGSVKEGYWMNATLVSSVSLGSKGCLLGDCQNGIGYFKWESGDTYLGEWGNGRINGFGRYDWTDGSFYAGNFKNDKFEGRGFYSSPTGEVMDGYFKENIFQGESAEYTADPDVFSGQFNTLLCSAPDDFSEHVGEKITKKGYLFDSYYYESKISLQGSIMSKFSGEGGGRSFIADYGTYRDEAYAHEVFEKLIKMVTTVHADCAALQETEETTYAHKSKLWVTTSPVSKLERIRVTVRIEKYEADAFEIMKGGTDEYNVTLNIKQYYSASARTPEFTDEFTQQFLKLLCSAPDFKDYVGEKQDGFFSSNNFDCKLQVQGIKSSFFGKNYSGGITYYADFGSFTEADAVKIYDDLTKLISKAHPDCASMGEVENTSGVYSDYHRYKQWEALIASSDNKISVRLTVGKSLDRYDVTLTIN